MVKGCPKVPCWKVLVEVFWTHCLPIFAGCLETEPASRVSNEAAMVLLMETPSWTASQKPEHAGDSQVQRGLSMHCVFSRADPHWWPS